MFEEEDPQMGVSEILTFTTQNAEFYKKIGNWNRPSQPNFFVKKIPSN